MDGLTLNPAFLQGLILNLRAVTAQEGLVMPDSGSNPTDDGVPAMLQDTPDNPVHDQLVTGIEDLEPDQQSQLVALMWIGRGDMEPEEWADALVLAAQRRKGPTSTYLLSHPQAAADMEDGLDKLLDGSDLMETGEY
jgi:hypothetical protein